MTVAALFVRPDGPYASMPGVELWDEARDARTYAGPWPVVAHPPCQRWGNFWWSARHKGLGLGDDGGCFAAAVDSVRRWGGVLEHPAGSRAWPRFGLPTPSPRGWTRGLIDGGWSAQVYQRNYGHRAMKLTWLYYVGDAPPPALDWSDPAKPEAWCSTDRPMAELRAMGVELMGKRERELTPQPFADLLVAMARGARVAQQEVA